MPERSEAGHLDPLQAGPAGAQHRTGFLRFALAAEVWNG
jgi:hypothetical protein